MKPTALFLSCLGMIALMTACGKDETPAPRDTTPPAAVTDLVAAALADSAAVLTWTAPGGDLASGRAAQYDIRYSTATITESVWDAATQCADEPTPGASGFSEEFTVAPLVPDTTYYFALKAADEAMNWSALSNVATASPGFETTYTFTFEDGMQGWSAKAIDVDFPNEDWSVSPATDVVYEGTGSVRFYLANYNDAGKVWMETPFYVNPSSLYHVALVYHFASADWGVVNAFRIIAGVLDRPAAVAADLTFQGNTLNSAESDVGFLWLDKSYEFDVVSSAEGKIYVSIGIWGTWETPRTYYVDLVSVTISSPE
jgi:chitodextrinase